MKLALFRRVPPLRSPTVSDPVIPPEARVAYPSLGSDFEVLDRIAAKAFHNSDLNALRHQHRYRRHQIMIVVGSAIVTGLGGLQAAYPDQRWPGVALTALSILLAASSRTVGELDALSEYLTERVKAERLRALHFRFLSRTRKFAGDDRVVVLKRAVIAIEAGREPA
jgi:hypothetical protein